MERPGGNPFDDRKQLPSGREDGGRKATNIQMSTYDPYGNKWEEGDDEGVRAEEAHVEDIVTRSPRPRPVEDTEDDAGSYISGGEEAETDDEDRAGGGDEGEGDEPDEEEKEVGESRRIDLNRPDLNILHPYLNNYVSTTKYKFWNFLPKNLFEQFRRVANVYFLIIAIVTLTPVSPVKPGAFVIALTVVLGATAVKEAVEDYKRYKSDKRVNNRTAIVLRASVPGENQHHETGLLASLKSAWHYAMGTKMVVGGQGIWEEVAWADVRVGDIVKVSNNKPFPADILLLSSSNPTGQCYIETANLDGETNLKIRQSLKETMGVSVVQDLLSLKGRIDCDLPHEDLYKYEGSLTLETEDGVKQIPLDTNQLLLRGSMLRNTSQIIGVAVYTGHETKFMLNTTDPPSKRSRVEKLMNRLILIVLAVELCLVLGSAIVGGVWEEVEGDDMWYLDFRDHFLFQIFQNFFTFLVLYSPMVPISLYVTLEFVRVIQAYFIESDLELYHAETDTPALARTSNLNEELGQIDYIFSDKTGTLTCNQMVFRVCSIGGTIYGEIPGVVIGEQPQVSIAIQQEPKKAASPTGGRKSKGKDSAKKKRASTSTRELLDSAMRRAQEQAGMVNVSMEVDESDDDTYDDHDSSTIDKGKGKDKDNFCVSQIKTEDIDFDDAKIFDHLEDDSHPNNEALKEFLTVLSVCHTVIPEEITEEGGSGSSIPDTSDATLETYSPYSTPSEKRVRYQAASPDESALVAAARYLGFYFHTRTHNTVTVQVMGTDQTFEVLNVLEFSSNRKRMSVIVRTQSGEIVLFCKGADSVIYERLAQKQKYADATSRHLNQFASAGLRTLCVATVHLDPIFYADWNARFKKASVSLVNRKGKLESLAEEIEVNMHLVGATGIEDRLQDGVPETIKHLLEAGIKVWVLTGDKRETAINIGKSCNLLKKDMCVLVLNCPSKAKTRKRIEYLTQLIESGNGAELLTQNEIDPDDPATSDATADARPGTGSSVKTENGSSSSSASPTIKAAHVPVPELALVIEGRTLVYALEHDLKFELLGLAQMCSTVVCCRTTPLQKTLVVKLVKDSEYHREEKPKLKGRIKTEFRRTRGYIMNKKRLTTLAIGDGANDVSMIQAAHVGVGISGREGMQAVLASDYAIAQFRFLERLLLIHGRYSYKRMSLLVLYFFYKNMLIALINFWWSFLAAFSGQTVWDAYLGIGYNLIFTALPIMIVAVMDMDVSMRAMDRFPRLYADGQQNLTLNTTSFLRYIGMAVLSSLIIISVSIVVFNNPVPNGRMLGLWDVNTVIYTCSVLVANFKLALETSRWTVLNHASLWPSMLSWFLVAAIYCSEAFLWLSPDMYFVIFNLFTLPYFWFTMLFVTVICLLPDFTFNYVQRMYYPHNYQIVQELLKQEAADEKKGLLPSLDSIAINPSLPSASLTVKETV